jgi:hypothetical protein
MFDQYPCNFFNVWLDVKPTHGHRLIFQAAPGSVQSGMDWYINDAGIVLTETTINQTRFDPNGLSEGSRSRRAMQYGDSIESVVRILGDDGNGLYTNEWLLADMHTSEIALFELGTKTSRLMRSSKNEWFGGTAGFYWGNNNTKDLAVRGETIAAANDRPADMTFCPEVRDQAWIGLYEQYKGKMDADFGRFAFSRPPLISRDSCDAKFATADMALRMESAAHWGDPYGQLWSPSPDGKAPDATPIVPNDWTLLKIKPPVKPATQPSTVAVDLIGVDDDGGDKNDTEPPPAWHGTLLPAGDGDIWLTSAFAAFHEYAARDNQMLKGVGDGDERSVNTDDLDRLTQRQRDELALSLFRYRSMATSQRNPQQSVPLRNIRSDVADDKWYRSATGRGVMLLSDLRRRLGEETFDKAMDAFGRAHAGRPVDSNAFVVAMSSTGVPGLDAFFARWLDTADALPTLEIKSALSTEKESKFVVSGTIVSHGGCTPAAVDVTVETHEGETTTAVPFTSNTADFHLPADNKPTRLVVNKYGRNACTNGWVWAASSYMRDLDHTIIVYGTRVEATANRIAAEKLQQGIVDRWEHLQIPIKADTQVGDDELRGHHVLLVGRPECSELIERFAGGLPVVFGPRSFSVRGQLYANADTAVIAAGVNPLDDRYSFVCVAGLNPGATLRAAVTLPDDSPAPLKLLPANQGSRSIVPPAVELTREFH